MKEQISAKSTYAMKIVLDLALYASKDRPRTFGEISKAQKISVHFISTIAVNLRRAGIIATVRGAKGGVYLAKPPEDLTLLETIEAVRGPVVVMPKLRGGNANRDISTTVIHTLWSEINDRMRALLASYTLAGTIRQLDQNGAKTMP